MDCFFLPKLSYKLESVIFLISNHKRFFKNPRPQPSDRRILFVLQKYIFSFNPKIFFKKTWKFSKYFCLYSRTRFVKIFFIFLSSRNLLSFKCAAKKPWLVYIILLNYAVTNTFLFATQWFNIFVIKNLFYFLFFGF